MSDTYTSDGIAPYVPTPDARGVKAEFSQEEYELFRKLFRKSCMMPTALNYPLTERGCLWKRLFNQAPDGWTAPVTWNYASNSYMWTFIERIAEHEEATYGRVRGLWGDPLRERRVKS
jgi:hypothetical protein